MIRTLTTLLLAAPCAALLVACGGGSGAMPFDAGTTSNTAATCTARVVTVALVGDSTMVGYLASTNAKAPINPGTRLQADMDAQFGPGAVIVTNDAVSGTISTQAPHVSADVIVANYGINDARAGLGLDAYKAAMLATGATLIETANPTFGTTYGPAFDEQPYVATAKGLGLPVADVYAYVQTLPGWQTMIPDGIHAGQALYILITDNVLAPAVAKQVAQIRCAA